MVFKCTYELLLLYVREKLSRKTEHTGGRVHGVHGGGVGGAGDVQPVLAQSIML